MYIFWVLCMCACVCANENQEAMPFWASKMPKKTTTTKELGKIGSVLMYSRTHHSLGIVLPLLSHALYVSLAHFPSCQNLLPSSFKERMYYHPAMCVWNWVSNLTHPNVQTNNRASVREKIYAVKNQIGWTWAYNEGAYSFTYASHPARVCLCVCV